MQIVLTVITVALIVVVGSALLIGNKMVDKMVHKDSEEAEALLAQVAAKGQRTSA
ncbi:hypothetical protein C7445_103155 [Alicyclobacillus sacchari]|uniref:Uncharacterized protein n=1 Tax=Alicyclobacillus sacchari TaxID=392010 RepID=A0A4R8LRA3_9BACL|nr:hypothetical protein [Alicyclobacillus sacchari]TDY50110.1 hypothetical protein C7445_103155 [Alicyclobacillus sacchari]GMA57530.1 hypothetical protein GCM10025858_20330 [Alicyclobacillus sacchari]